MGNQNNCKDYEYKGKPILKDEFINILKNCINRTRQLNQYNNCADNEKVRIAFQQTCKYFGTYYDEYLCSLLNIEKDSNPTAIYNKYFRLLRLNQYKDKTYCVAHNKNIKTNINVDFLDGVLSSLGIENKDENGIWLDPYTLISNIAGAWRYLNLDSQRAIAKGVLGEKLQ